MTNGQFISVIAAGGVTGAMCALPIYMEPREPHKHFIVAAATLRGVITALLITTLVTLATSYLASTAYGACFGLLTAATVYLAKGGWKSGDVPFIIPLGLVQGVIAGVLVRWLLS